MKKLNKKVKLLILISLIGILYITYSNYNKTRLIYDFNLYLSSYKESITGYEFYDLEDDYETLLLDCYETINKKDYKNISDLESDLLNLKENLDKENIEKSYELVEELELLDISILNSTELFENKISDINELLNNKLYIKANKLSKELKEVTLQMIEEEKTKKLKEEEEKKLEEEAKLKKLAEEEKGKDIIRIQTYISRKTDDPMEKYAMVTIREISDSYIDILITIMTPFLFDDGKTVGSNAFQVFGNLPGNDNLWSGEFTNPAYGYPIDTTISMENGILTLNILDTTYYLYPESDLN